MANQRQGMRDMLVKVLKAHFTAEEINTFVRAGISLSEASAPENWDYINRGDGQKLSLCLSSRFPYDDPNDLVSTVGRVSAGLLVTRPTLGNAADDGFFAQMAEPLEGFLEGLTAIGATEMFGAIPRRVANYQGEFGVGDEEDVNSEEVLPTFADGRSVSNFLTQFTVSGQSKWSDL